VSIARAAMLASSLIHLILSSHFWILWVTVRASLSGSFNPLYRSAMPLDRRSNALAGYFGIWNPLASRDIPQSPHMHAGAVVTARMVSLSNPID
jgi:hypothetical protein